MAFPGFRGLPQSRVWKAAVSTAARRLLPGRETGFEALRRLRERVDACATTGEAAASLEASKAALAGLLGKRFGPVEAQALALKIVNLLLARRELRAREAAVRSRPFGLVIDPSNVCQLACPGCVHSPSAEARELFDWPKATLAEQRLARLLRLYGPAAVGVYFCNYGEPLLNRSTPALIRMAKSYLAATALSTSLSVRQFDADAYVASGLDVMIISIDGATQRVYERFRRNGDLELALANVARLAESKRRRGSRTPLLSWNFLAFEHNAHEIPAAERMARKLGVNVFRVVQPFDVTWDDPDIRPAAVRPYVRRLDWTSISNAPENWNAFPENVDAAAIRAAFEKPVEAGAAGEAPPGPGHTCHWLYQNMVMDAKGRILPCCGAPGQDGRLVFGSFDAEGCDPFDSPRYRQARAFFAGGSGDDVQCGGCEWDHTAVSIGEAEIRRYFRAAHPGFFDRRSLELLSVTQ